MKSKATWENNYTCTMGKNDTAILTARHERTCKTGWLGIEYGCQTRKIRTLYCPADYIPGGKQRYLNKKIVHDDDNTLFSAWPEYGFQKGGAANQSNRPITQKFSPGGYQIVCKDPNYFVKVVAPPDNAAGRVIYKCELSN